MGALLLETVLYLHHERLWAEPQYMLLVGLSFVAPPLMQLVSGRGPSAFSAGAALGWVAGEAVGYFWVVPWRLILICIEHARYDVLAVSWLRVIACSFVWTAYKQRALRTDVKYTTALPGFEHSLSTGKLRAMWTGTGMTGILLGLLITLPFAAISGLEQGSWRPATIARQKALAQLVTSR